MTCLHPPLVKSRPDEEDSLFSLRDSDGARLTRHADELDVELRSPGVTVPKTDIFEGNRGV